MSYIWHHRAEEIMAVQKILFVSLPVIVLGLGACEDKGPAESAGQNIDQAVEKAKE
jgi:hypothetical protein